MSNSPDWLAFRRIDQMVCDYARANVAEYLDHSVAVEEEAAEQPKRHRLTNDGVRREHRDFEAKFPDAGGPSYTRWLRAQLDERIFRALAAGWDGPLAVDEIADVADVIDGMPKGFTGTWRPWPAPHRAIVELLQSQSKALGRSTWVALDRDWSDFQRIDETTPLVEGLEHACVALAAQRSLMVAAGQDELVPCPVGPTPTPTHRRQDRLPEPPEGKAHIRDIRKAFLHDSKLRRASKEFVREQVGGRRGDIYKALDWLADQGEYVPKSRNLS
jgi:hypothetical protein